MIPFVRKSVHLALSDAFEQHMTKLKRVLKTFRIDSNLDNPVYGDPYEAIEKHINALKLRFSGENTAKHAAEAKVKRLEDKLDLSLKLAREVRIDGATQLLRKIVHADSTAIRDDLFDEAVDFLKKLDELSRESDHMIKRTVELKEPLIKGVGMTSGEIREKPARVRQQDSRSISGGQVSSQPRSQELRQDDYLLNPAHPASPLHPIHHHTPAPEPVRCEAPTRSYEPSYDSGSRSEPCSSPSDNSCSSPSSCD